MKKIEAVIQPDRLDAAKAALEESGYMDLMVTEIENHTKGSCVTRICRGGEYQVPQSMFKLEVVVADKEKAVNKVREILQAASKSRMGEGKIFVYDIAETYAIPAMAKVAV